MCEPLQMMSQEQAAKYLVVAWCKDWKMAMLLHAVCGTKFNADDFKPLEPLIAASHEAFPWMPNSIGPYVKGGLVRQFVGMHYPKLSAWLSTRSTDLERMRCAGQIQRLKCSAPKQRLISTEDQKEKNRQRREERAVMAAYEIVRAAKKTHSRSAWGVCKK